MKPIRRVLAPALVALTALLGFNGRASADPANFMGDEANGVFGDDHTGDSVVHSLTGALNQSFRFELAPARGNVQPSLVLGYSSSASEREAGYGWGLGLPVIELKPLSGFPIFDLTPAGKPPASEPRYTLSGAPLVRICVVGGCPVEEHIDNHPLWASGWTYYRHQVEGSFARIYQSPDLRTFRVQLKGGRILELGEMKAAGGFDTYAVPPAFETERPGSPNIVRWRLVAERDGLHPKNVAAYRWVQMGVRGLIYLTDIYDTPSLEGDSTSLSEFANHTQLDWEPSGLANASYAFVDRAIPDFRLRRVAVASKPWSGNGNREIVRKYPLFYLAPRAIPYVPGAQAPLWNHNFLSRIGNSGHCGSEDGTGSIPDNVDCVALPTTTFEYSSGAITGFATSAPVLVGPAPGAVNSRDVITNEALAAVLDFNRDGLPDVVEGWPWTCNGHATQMRTGWIFCGADENSTPLQDGRVIRAYANVGQANIQQRLAFQCFDASTLATTNQGGRPSLLGHGGPNIFGRWSEAQFLWAASDLEGHATSAFLPIVSRRLTTDGVACATSANPTQTFPSWRFESANSADWSRLQPRTLMAEKPAWYVDVDGDGMSDLLLRTDTPPAQNDQLQAAKVLFTRQRSAKWFSDMPARLSVFDESTATDYHAIVPTVTTDPAHENATRIYFVDVNGDGLVDAVTSLAFQQFRVRPGDGHGKFACDPIHESGGAPCDITGNGPSNAYSVEIVDPPNQTLPRPWWDGNGEPEPPGTWHDVTGDGLADIIKLDSNGYVRVWVNFDGRHFGCPLSTVDLCVVGRITDDVHANEPAIGSGLRFADMNGDGVDDLLTVTKAGVFVGSLYTTPSPGGLAPRAPRPGLLVRIDNGRGATTSVGYSTVQELDLAATASGHPWAHHLPSVETVVSTINTKDTTTANGGQAPQPYAVERNVSYTYSEPAYDRWQRRFLGFRSVKQQVGYESAVTETTRWFGPCENDTIAALGLNDSSPTPACAQTSDDDPNDARTYKALVGRVVRVDRYVPNAINQTSPGYLWSKSFVYDPPVDVLDAPVEDHLDRRIRFTYPRRVEMHLYDPSDTVSFPAGASLLAGGDDLVGSPSQFVEKVLVQTMTVDPHTGTILETRSTGDTNTGDVERVTRVSLDGETPGIQCTADLQCRPNYTLSLYVESGFDLMLQRKRFAYNGPHLTSVEAELLQNHWVDRRHSGGGAFASDAPGQAIAGWKTIASFEYDPATGFPTKITGAGSTSSSPASCTKLTFDAPYHHYAETIEAFSNGCDGANSEGLRTDQVFDRGFGIAVRTTAPDFGMSSITLDAAGAVSEVYVPDIDNPAMQTLAANIFHSPFGNVPWVRAHTYPSPGVDMETVQLANGLGEPIASFQSDADGRWIVSGYTLRDTTGRTNATYRPWKETAASDPVTTALGLGSIPIPGTSLPTTFGYDGFGRHQYTSEASQVLVEKTYFPLAVQTRDAEQVAGGSHTTGLRRVELTGHGQVGRVVDVTSDETITTENVYDGVGQLVQVVKSSSSGGLYYRTLAYDSLGRMTLNIEPNTSKDYAWRYAWDDANRLVGTSDARGCGKNMFYDGLGRLVAEDYSPCTSDQPAYTAPLAGDGFEATYQYDRYEDGQEASDATFFDAPDSAKGRLVASRDRGSHTRTNFDRRGNARRSSRRIVRPWDATIGDGYTADWFVQRADVDQADRITRKTTGASTAPFLVGGASEETRAYDQRGFLSVVGSSYGALIRSTSYEPDGQPTSVVFDDAARTTMAFQYDTRRRLEHLDVTRNAPAGWSTASANYSLPTADTTQTDLARLQFTYDAVGNPLVIQDNATSSWPSGATTTATRTATYDDLYRLTSIDYAYGGDDTQVNPFNAEFDAHDRSPAPRSLPSTRVHSQSFGYDYMNNVTSSNDDAAVRFDRSLGIMNHGPFQDGPNQLRSTQDGSVNAKYDDAGNLTRLKVERPGPCPSARNIPDKCAQWFEYTWDEIGQLSRARRWDYDATLPVPLDDAVPTDTPVWDLHYAYSGGVRTLKTVNEEGSDDTRSTLEIFDSYRLEHVPFAVDGNYRIGEENVHLYIGGLGHVLSNASLPRPPEPGYPDGNPVHMFIQVPDHLGSTGIVIDRATSEVVERASHQAFGAIESDYRPERWYSDRENYKFTGKEEDIEVGLHYFGARYYNARLNRWISPDPLTIHALGADLNPYSYVRGRPMVATDRFGLDGEDVSGLDPEDKDGEVEAVSGPPPVDPDEVTPFTWRIPSNSPSG